MAQFAVASYDRLVAEPRPWFSKVLPIVAAPWPALCGKNIQMLASYLDSFGPEADIHVELCPHATCSKLQVGVGPVFSRRGDHRFVIVHLHEGEERRDHVLASELRLKFKGAGIECEW